MKTEKSCNNTNNEIQKDHQEEEQELRRGPWTLEEDTLLIHYVACHGEGRWNLLAKSAGLKRTGKSCRLRWLNYLKPDIKRGNLSPQEQLLILELHSKWGNRWSKIAAHLPGRTDNEIKNYWRTRVQKQARQLNMESNSQSFIDAIRCFYMPRLVEKIEQNSSDHEIISVNPNDQSQIILSNNSILDDSNASLSYQHQQHPTSSKSSSSLVLDDHEPSHSCTYDVDMSASMSSSDVPFDGCHVERNDWIGNDMAGDSMWDLDELWQFRK
ncbi:unnamed protein product [Amaranthus hypochondriacus]